MRSSSRNASVVLRNPDSTKNTCTPIHPFARTHALPPKWNTTTSTAAIARTPSSAGNRLVAR